MSNLEKKVNIEIQKTGLPTEIKATKMLKDNGWHVLNEYPYLDREENKIRTLDIRATKVFLKFDSAKSVNSSEIDSGCELYIECKKSVKHFWVFHTASMSDSFINFGIDRLAYDFTHETFNKALKLYAKSAKISDIGDLMEPTTILSKIPVRFENMDYKIALSHQVVSGGKDDFYEATMQILKALHHRDEEDRLIPPEISFKNRMIPIILFDGNIFGCYYDDEQLLTPKTEYTRYLAHGLPNQRIPALIDVMTLNHFPKYLKLIEEAFLPS